MPEVFDHFFRLCGTSADEQLDLVRLDPGYRVYFENRPESVDIRSDRAASTALFESLYASGIEHGLTDLDHSGLFVELASRNGMS